MLVLLGIHVLRIAELLLGALHRGLDCGLIDLVLGDGVLGEDPDPITVDLGKAATDGEPLDRAALGDAEFGVRFG